MKVRRKVCDDTVCSQRQTLVNIFQDQFLLPSSKHGQPRAPEDSDDDL